MARSIYNHRRASTVYSKGKSTREVSTIAACIEALNGYGYHKEADNLSVRLAALQVTPPAEKLAEVTTQGGPKRRAKKAKKEAS